MLFPPTLADAWGNVSRSPAPEPHEQRGAVYPVFRCFGCGAEGMTSCKPCTRRFVKMIGREVREASTSRTRSR